MSIINPRQPLVYYAAPLSAASSPGYIENLGRMLRGGLRLMQRGYPVVIPGEDLLRGLVAASLGQPLTYDDLFDNSRVVMRRCDVLYRDRSSEGVIREVDDMRNLGKPVVETNLALWEFAEQFRAQSGG